MSPVCGIFYYRSTAPSSGHFNRRRFTRNLLTTAVSARPLFDMEKTPRRPAPPAAELLQSLQEKDRNSAQQKSQCDGLGGNGSVGKKSDALHYSELYDDDRRLLLSVNECLPSSMGFPHGHPRQAGAPF